MEAVSTSYLYSWVLLNVNSTKDIQVNGDCASGNQPPSTLQKKIAQGWMLTVGGVNFWGVCQVARGKLSDISSL